MCRLTELKPGISEVKSSRDARCVESACPAEHNTVSRQGHALT